MTARFIGLTFEVAAAIFEGWDRAVNAALVGSVIACCVNSKEMALPPRFIWTIGLAIAGQVLYHMGQRSVPREAPSLLVLGVAYCVASVLCFLSAPATGITLSFNDLRACLGWPTWAITLSIVGIELGYLLAYRDGWSIGTAFAVASTATTVALALIGLAAFGNAISARRFLGLAVACVSLWLLSGGAPEE